VSVDARLDNVLPPDLPKGADLIREGRERAAAIERPVNRYARERGVHSTREWKDIVRRRHGLMTYINLGYKTWAEQREAVEYIQAQGQRYGFVLDRQTLVPDRRMGLPSELRPLALEETGIMMYGQEDWNGAAQDLDVSVVMNDHSLGTPSSIENTTAMLTAGFDYIGNVSQHNYGYDLWSDDVEQIRRTVVALGMLAEKKSDGVVAEAYIEDGDVGGFHDLATSIGWCMFHRYVVEDLIGAAHSQSFGSTFQDPTLKMAFNLALQEINVHNVPMSFVHGDTNSFETDGHLDRNAAIVFNDVFHTAMVELKHPSGAAIHATPTTEAIRIPTPDELVQSLLIVDEAWKCAERSQHLFDWRPVYAVRDQITAGGRQFFERMMAGFADLGIDTKDPMHLLLAARRLGGGQLETMFGVGEPNTDYPRGFTPTVMSDTLRRHLRNVQMVLDRLKSQGLVDLSGHTIVSASCDIHEYGLFVVSRVLESLGAKVIDLGTSVSTPDIAKVVRETAADAVAVSTYNGMAFSLGRQLLAELEKRDVRPDVFFGGRLNEDWQGGSAVDMTDHLEEVGINACATLEEMVARLGGIRPLNRVWRR
jgi:methylmalonyl-CoA mutase cobalamin-binding subunit